MPIVKTDRPPVMIRLVQVKPVLYVPPLDAPHYEAGYQARSGEPFQFLSGEDIEFLSGEIMAEL